MADIDPVIREYMKGVDRSLLQEALKLTPEQRVRKLMELQKLAEEARRAMLEARKAQEKP